MGVTEVDPPRLFDVRSDESAARAINSADYFGVAGVGLFRFYPPLLQPCRAKKLVAGKCEIAAPCDFFAVTNIVP
jgi:hypothetical protein